MRPAWIPTTSQDRVRDALVRATGTRLLGRNENVAGAIFGIALTITDYWFLVAGRG